MGVGKQQLSHELNLGLPAFEINDLLRHRPTPTHVHVGVMILCHFGGCLVATYLSLLCGAMTCCVFVEHYDWLGCWGKHMKAPGFKSIRDYQKLNHFPGSFQIGRKDRLWRNVSKLQVCVIYFFTEFKTVKPSHYQSN